MDVSALLVLLFYLVIVGLIFYVIWWGLGQITLPEPIGKVIRVVVIVVFVLILVYFLLGILPPVHQIKIMR